MMGVLLELLEQAGDDAASGGPGEANLVVDDDGGVDGGADQGVADDVKVGLIGGGGVAHGDPHVHKAGEVSLQALDDLREGLQVLDLDLLLLLADGEVLQLAAKDMKTDIADLFSTFREIDISKIGASDDEEMEESPRE